MQEQINKDIHLLVQENRKLHALNKKALYKMKMLSSPSKVEDAVMLSSPIASPNNVDNDVWTSFTEIDDKMDYL